MQNIIYCFIAGALCLMLVACVLHMILILRERTDRLESVLKQTHHAHLLNETDTTK